MSSYTKTGIALGALIWVTTIVLGLIFDSSQSPYYESSAKIWVKPKIAEMVPSSYQTSLYAPLTAFFNSPIATAGEVLKSDIVLNEAVSRIQKQYPNGEGPTVDDMRSGISVDASGSADILNIGFRYSEPKGCKIALDALLDAFIEVNSAQSAQSAVQSRIFLERQLKQSQEDSLRARLAVEKFQKDNDEINLDEETNRRLTQISELEISINKSRAKISELQSKIAYLNGQLKIDPEDAMIAERLSTDEITKNLKGKIALDEVKLIDYRSKLREEHPRIQQLKITIEQSKDALRDRVREIIGELGASNTSPDAVLTENPVQQKLLTDMVNARADELAEQTSLVTLQRELAALRTQMSVVPAQQVKLAELKRSATVAEAILSDTERNLHSTRLLESVASKASNIQILDRPAIPTAPSNPKSNMKGAVSAALGFVLGAGAFVGVYLLNPSAQRISDVLNLLPLPIIGWIEQLSDDTGTQEVLPGIHQLQVNLKAWLSNERSTIVVTSGDYGDGKTVLACGLAISLARTGLRVLLVDVNFAGPALHEVFRLDNSYGLTNYLNKVDPAQIEKMIYPVKENLEVIPVGTGKSFAGALDSPKFEALLHRLKSRCEILILDTPSASDSADAFSLLDNTVNLIIAVRLNHTYRDSLKLLSAQLKQQETAAAGLVFFGASKRAIVAALAAQPAAAEEAPAAGAQAPPTESTTSRW